MYVEGEATLNSYEDSEGKNRTSFSILQSESPTEIPP